MLDQKSVVYLATNKVNGKVYVGATVQSLRRRQKEHIWKAFKKNSQSLFHIALRQYGAASFEWVVVFSHSDFDVLREEEARVISQHIAHCYNMLRRGIHAGMPLGFKHTDETKKKIGAAHVGKKVSVETKKKLSAAQKGKKASEETKKKISKAQKGNQRCLGFKHTDETKKKVAEASRGRKHTDATKQKMSDAHKLHKYNLGSKRTDETKKKMSEAQKGNQNCVGHKPSDETKKKMAEAHKLRCARKRQQRYEEFSAFLADGFVE